MPKHKKNNSIGLIGLVFVHQKRLFILSFFRQVFVSRCFVFFLSVFHEKFFGLLFSDFISTHLGWDFLKSKENVNCLLLLQCLKKKQTSRYYFVASFFLLFRQYLSGILNTQVLGEISLKNVNAFFPLFIIQ